VRAAEQARAGLETALADKRAELTALDSTVTSRRRELAQAETAQAERLAATVAEAQATIAKFQAARDQLTAEVQALNAQKRDLLAGIERDSQAAIRAAELALATRKKELEGELATLERDLERTKTEMADLRSRLAVR
jgi:chromosome segregation ATPase